MMRLLVLVLMAVLTLSCSSPDLPPPDGCGRTFIVAPEFTKAERIAMASAVERWNEISNEAFCLKPAQKVGEAEVVNHGVYRIPYKGAYWQEWSKALGNVDFIGLHFGRSDQIGIVDSLSPESFELVALHEFGHAHGLGHLPPPAIMCAYVGTASDFTANDMRECERVGACSSGQDAEAPPTSVDLPPITQATLAPERP